MRLETPDDLRRVMGAAFAPSQQQWAAITAPLAPAVVVAGAGSGKTTLMAARVVYLVVTGQVRPEEVLGLTFTTKAAAELRRTDPRPPSRARGRCPTPPRHRVRPRGPRRGPRGARASSRRSLTYNAYAAQLLTEHGLRIGHEPDTRVVTDAARYQLGARVVDRFTGGRASTSPTTRHRDPEPPRPRRRDERAPRRTRRRPGASTPGRASASCAALAEERRARTARPPRGLREGDLSRSTGARELLQLVAGYRRLKADLGLMDFSDQIELGARLAVEQPEVGERERARFRVVLLDEYQDTSVAQALMLARLFSGEDAAEAAATR